MTEPGGEPGPGAADLAPYAVDVAAFLSSRRSKKLLQLFSFLLDQSQLGVQPSEKEIAESICAAQDAGENAPASSGRVYVSRLRKLMDEFYAGHAGPRLVIPRGEYRLALQPGAQPASDSPRDVADGEDRAASAAPRPHRRASIWLGLVALVALNVGLAATYWHTSRTKPTLTETALWQPFAASPLPTVIAVGDHFLFGERRGGRVEIIVRDLGVANRTELAKHYPGGAQRSDAPVDLDLAYTSSNLVFALRSVRLALDRAKISPTIIPASQLDPAMFRSSNIVYLGPIDGLGPVLGPALFRVSGFGLRKSDGTFFDKRTQAAYRSDLTPLSAESVPLRDYGFLASFPGPSGNRIVVISGLGDAGLTQMGDLVTSSSDLAKLSAAVKAPAITGNASNDVAAFEALYQVKMLYSESFGRSVVVARSLGNRTFWATAWPIPR